MRTIDDAIREILPSFSPLEPLATPISDALGMFLAEDVAATTDLPPFDNSAMDGYAVRAGEHTRPPMWVPVRGESRAGGPLPAPLEPGAAMRIFTGAPLPQGADAIVMQEDTLRDGDRVEIRIAPKPGAHVRMRGSDLRAGAVMLARGAAIGPGEIGLLAAQRHPTVQVHRRPRVALLSTGDELREIADAPEPGTIVNSNAYALAAQVREAGGDPWVLPNAPDRLDAIVAAVRDGLTADVLVTIGGVSVGEYDLVHEALAALGIERAFWKVAIKPGKPLAFARAGRVPVIGLPGNPVSAMVTFEVFVRPGIRRMLGDPSPHRPRETVELAAPHRHSTGRLELARATLERRGDRRIAHLHPLQGSGSLPSMVGIDAFVLLPADREHFTAGEKLSAIVLRPPTTPLETAFSATPEAAP